MQKSGKLMKIQTTKQYDLFKIRETNRQIKQKSVDKLIDSINNYGYLSFFPIIVDKEMNIIDGQHRFMACKKMDIPISYTIYDGYDSENLMCNVNNTQSSWKQGDYLDYYCKLGYPEYIKLKNVLDKYKSISLSICISYSINYGSRARWDYFKTGKYIQNENKIKSLIENDGVVFECLNKLKAASLEDRKS